MKKRAGIMALLVLWGCHTELSTHGTEPTAEPSTAEFATVTGELLMITGSFVLVRDLQGEEVLKARDEMYVIREESGHEVPVPVNEDTRIDPARRVSTGDMVEVTLSPEGRALSVMPAR